MSSKDVSFDSFGRLENQHWRLDLVRNAEKPSQWAFVLRDKTGQVEDAMILTSVDTMQKMFEGCLAIIKKSGRQ